MSSAQVKNAATLSTAAHANSSEDWLKIHEMFISSVNFLALFQKAEGLNRLTAKWISKKQKLIHIGNNIRR